MYATNLNARMMESSATSGFIDLTFECMFRQLFQSQSPTKNQQRLRDLLPTEDDFHYPATRLRNIIIVIIYYFASMTHIYFLPTFLVYRNHLIVQISVQDTSHR